jgi:predicted regulator of Ras-like GTPase activity (Roadblock/LC7/MglB family)
VDLPANHVLAHVVPTLSLSVLAELMPDFVEPSSQVIRLPASRVALNYRLDEDRADLPKHEHDLKSSAKNPAPSFFSSPVVHLDSLLAHSVPEQEAPIAEEEAPLPAAQEVVPETAPEATRKLSDMISNLPTFRRKTVQETELAPVKIERKVAPRPQTDESQEIPDQDGLQALFLTDEKLSIKRVVELCGGLPGIKSCLLTNEDQVIASHNVPEGMDIVSLSANATKMLRTMHDASAEMGIGQIPAVTLHTEKGPISIFQKDHLNMLVFHGDRGFIPGVREKMTAALGEMSNSQLSLPAPEAKS